MSENEYTLPGVMRFLQLEWQKAERDRIQWDLERAELRSRLAKADADRVRLQQQLDVMSRRSSITDEKLTVEAEIGEESRRLAALREYIGQCVAEVSFLLEQNGIPTDQVSPGSAAGQNNSSTGATGARKRLLHTLAGVEGGATALAIASDKVAAIGDASGKLLLWNAASDSGACAASTAAKVAQEQAHQGAVAGIVACDREAYSCGEDGTLAAWELCPGTTSQIKLLARAVAHTKPIVALVQHPGENIIVTASEDGDVKFWNSIALASAGGSAEMPALMPPHALLHVRRYTEMPGVLPTALKYINNGGHKLLVGFSDGGIVLADGLGMLVRRVFTPSTSAVLAPVLPSINCLAMPDEQHIVAGLATGDLILYDFNNGAVLDEARGAHNGGVTSMASRPNSQRGMLLSGGKDGLVAMWTVALGALSWKARLLSHDSLECGGIAALALRHGGAAVAGKDGIVRLYDVGDL